MQFRFLRTDGAAVTHADDAGAARVTLDPRSVAGIAADRVLDGRRIGRRCRRRSHDELGRERLRQPRRNRRSRQPSTTWFLAEGATHGGFDLFYLVQNPNATDGAGHGALSACRRRLAPIVEDLHGGAPTAAPRSGSIRRVERPALAEHRRLGRHHARRRADHRRARDVS